MIAKIGVAPHREGINSALGSTASINKKLLATSAHEILAILVTAGSADIVVGIYDAKDVNSLDPAKAVYVGANQGESFDWSPAASIPFENGIVLQIEQGGFPFNGKVTILYT